MQALLCHNNVESADRLSNQLKELFKRMNTENQLINKILIRPIVEKTLNYQKNH
jgi:hypothetical protein